MGRQRSGDGVPARKTARMGHVEKTPYQIATEPGKPHHGWLLAQRELPTVKLRKAIRSLLKQIAQHEAWISNPYLKFAANEQPEIIRYHQQVKWRNDIARQREQVNILEGVIHERESQK